MYNEEETVGDVDEDTESPNDEMEIENYDE